MIDNNLTASYLGRPTDKRMISVINKYVSKYQTILDLGCGSGLYGKFLSRNDARVLGYDHDPVLCEKSNNTNYYETVFCDDILRLPEKVKKVDVIFCSELLEHISNSKIEAVLSAMEEITEHQIVITVPNPLSPHFKQDPSHILEYSVYSFLEMLNKSDKFTYRLYPLGFAEQHLQQMLFRLLNSVASRIALFSPTVLYVGVIKK